MKKKTYCLIKQETLDKYVHVQTAEGPYLKEGVFEYLGKENNILHVKDLETEKEYHVIPRDFRLIESAGRCNLRKDLIDCNIKVPTREGIDIGPGLYEVIEIFENNNDGDGFNFQFLDTENKKLYHAASINFEFF